MRGILLHDCSIELHYIIMATAESGKHPTLGANRLNLVHVISVVSLHGKDALGSLVLPNDTGAKPFTQWGNIVHHVLAILVVEMISSF